jgi:hypothetical protein
MPAVMASLKMATNEYMLHYMICVLTFREEAGNFLARNWIAPFTLHVCEVKNILLV